MNLEEPLVLWFEQFPPNSQFVGCYARIVFFQVAYQRHQIDSMKTNFFFNSTEMKVFIYIMHLERE